MRMVRTGNAKEDVRRADLAPALTCENGQMGDREEIYLRVDPNDSLRDEYDDLFVRTQPGVLEHREYLAGRYWIVFRDTGQTRDGTDGNIVRIFELTTKVVRTAH
ncbi:hypothetical protein ACIBEJ_17910 [Nonomuraea sp. NPDC050790]|uniref:hypothetical protein n=1 Tax=Nonomuraea sp. NPDC050790 TaxID=3364371 RepID=UPI0037876C08